MIWKDFSKAFRDGDHAFLSPSQHAWYNYDEEKFVTTYINKLAASRGTALHELARRMISLQVRLPDDGSTLSMYVNDAIDMKLRPEEKLYYSEFCFGTADAIDYRDCILHIHDLKTGRTKVSFLQLDLYAALFFLCYPDVKMALVKDIELRIYQNNEVLVEHRTMDEIFPVMETIRQRSQLLTMLKEDYDAGFDSLGRRA